MFTLSTQTFAAIQHQNGATNYSLDFLYWQLRAGSASNWAQIITAPGTEQSSTIVGVPFTFNPGYRIGIGRNSANHAWDIQASFTSYQTTASTSTSGRVFSAYLGNFYAGNTDGSKFGPYYDSGNIRWQFNYKVFDANVGRQFNIDDHFSLHPAAGLRLAFLNNQWFTNWDGPNSSAVPPTTYTFTHSTEDLKNNFWGIGPSLNLDTTFPIVKNINLIGNFTSALFWGHWRFKDLFKANNNTTIEIKSSNIQGAATMAGLLLGLEWQKKYPHADIRMRLGYEAQIWLSQMQYYSYNMGRLNNLLSLQGGTFNISVNY